MTEYIYPKRIVKSSGFLDDVDNLLVKKEMQIGLAEKKVSTIKGKGYIILDFGKEMCGGIQILIYRVNKPTSRIRVRFGESLTETGASAGEDSSTNDHAIRDSEYLITSFSSQKIGDTGFRFIRIDFLDDVEVLIKSIICVNEILKKRPIYLYEGKDNLIKNIFKTARRTIDLCSSSGYIWDGIKRDRLVWIGDMHPEMLAITTLYGRTDEVERSLDYIRNQTLLPDFMCGMPTYSMWWPIIICDYYELTKNDDFIGRQITYLTKLMDLFDEYVSDDGEMHYPSYFVDWPTVGTGDDISGSRAIHIISVKKTMSLFKHFNLPTEKLSNLLNKLLKKEIVVKEKKQVIALKYFALGEISDKEYEMLIDGGCKGFSTFMSYYILTTIASRDKDLAIKLMKEYYGAMLELGATTFFEDFNIDWTKNAGKITSTCSKKIDIHKTYGDFCYKGYRHSLCHGWSCGVIRFIYENCK